MSFGNPQIISSQGSSASPTPVAQNPPVAQTSNKTPAGGVPLINGTQTILSAVAPADGVMHKATVWISHVVTTTEVGGGINLQWTAGGVSTSTPLVAVSKAAGVYGSVNPTTVLCDPGTPVSVVQANALTGGVANCNAEIDIV